MKHLLFVTAAICISANLLAQPPVLDWAKRIGGGGYDISLSSTVDAAGNIYTTGHFEGLVDFDPGTGVNNMLAIGPYDTYVCKLDNSGNFVWAKQMGGTDFNIGNFIINDASGNIYVTGIFQGTTDFDPGAGVFNLTSLGIRDIFLFKLDAAGNFTWAKSIGGPNDDYEFSLAVGASGNVYITGYFKDSIDCDPGSGTYNLTSEGGFDFFISKLDISGNFVWAKRIGSNNSDISRSICLDAMENIYTTGEISSLSLDFDPGPGTYILNISGSPNAFISKLDSSGNFVWAKILKGSVQGTTAGYCITTDVSGNIYTTGTLDAITDFDPDSAGYFPLNGHEDPYISKLDSDGNFVWAKNFSSDDYDIGYSIAVDAAQNVYSTGYFMGLLPLDMDPGPGTYYLGPSMGFEDMYVSKLDSSGNFVWAYENDGYSCDGRSINVDGAGNIYTAGYFSGTADFDPDSSAAFYMSATGPQNIFIVKLHDSPTGIPENNRADEFKIFPNPTHGDFTIQAGKQYDAITVKIMNVTGQEVFNASYLSTNTMNVIFDPPPGIYIVEMGSSEGKIVRIRMVVV